MNKKDQNIQTDEPMVDNKQPEKEINTDRSENKQAQQPEENKPESKSETEKNQESTEKKTTTKKRKSKTQEKIETLEAQLAEKETKLAEEKDKFLRLYAEFENFRKRTAREKVELNKTAAERVISKLLPVMDDYERAQQAIEKDNDLQHFKEGIALIADKFYKSLQNEGLEVIESNNQPFNTDEHEAITKMAAPTDEHKNKVIDTIEKGYKLNGKVIRFAKVVVGN
jgi:molecular chaperone GrpE